MKICKTCSQLIEFNVDTCEKCCEHDDICLDERCCLICGKDMTEHLMAAAYDRAKDRRKYGDD